MNKAQWYNFLFGQVDKAIANDYYFEAAFICYGIIEDRLSSLMNLYSLPIGRKGVSQKIKAIAKQKDPVLEQILLFKDWDGGKYRDVGLLKPCLDWGALYRNPMQHILGDPRNYQSMSGNLHNANTKDLAEEGKVVARELSSAVMRLKKKL